MGRRGRGGSPPPRGGLAPSGWNPAGTGSAPPAGGGGRAGFSGYMEEKRRKLEGVCAAERAPGGPMEGVRIHVNGFTEPSREDLRSLILSAGGGFEAYWSRRATHMVCSGLCEASRRRLGHDRRAVVRPEWVVDSVAAGKSLPVRGYLIERHPPGPPGPRQQRFSEAPPAQSPGLKTAQEVAARARAGCKVLQRGPMSTREDPDYVKHFFEASRLAFIGSWQDRWEALQSSLQGEAPRKGTVGGKSPSSRGNRTVLHVDMDCFFASVATLENPAARGRPLAVSHSSGSGWGEIASANYEARRFGLRAGMTMNKAKQLCPELIVMPYAFDAYERVSEQMYRIFLRHSPRVKPVSCDEGYLDLTGCEDPEKVAATIRAEIAKETGCTASAGISSNMLLARLATAQAKPDGQRRLTFLEGRALLEDLPVGELPGVGWKAKEKFAELGVGTCGELRRLDKKTVQEKFGAKLGETLYERAQGIDGEQVTLPPRKSITVEITYGVRFDERADVNKFISDMAAELASRVRKRGSQGGFKLTLKIKKRKENAGAPRKHLGHGPCIDLSRSMRSSTPLGTDAEEVAREAGALFRSLLDAKVLEVQEVRGLGVTLDNLSEAEASNSPAQPPKEERLPTMLRRAAARPLVDSAPQEAQLPPASQLDPQVLEAIPSELLRALEVDYGRALVDKNRAAVKKPALRFERARRAPERSRRRQGVDDNGILTMTQCDPEVLAQLGPEILAEIRKTYFGSRNDLPLQEWCVSDVLEERAEADAIEPRRVSQGQRAPSPQPPLAEETIEKCTSVPQLLDVLNACLREPESSLDAATSPLTGSIIEYLGGLVESQPVQVRKALRWIRRSVDSGNSPHLGHFPGGGPITRPSWKSAAQHIVLEVQARVAEAWGAPLNLEDAVLPSGSAPAPRPPPESD